MFSFHKPKIYRSLKGCCICRAKSSSSRFTDSKRYEGDFAKCFEIFEKRTGEICNACVLLVKRWKKLPNGSNRNWHHVVDARAGPGTKSMNKIKNKAKLEEKLNRRKYKHKKRTILNQAPSSPGGVSDDVLGDDCFSEGSYECGYLTNSDCSDGEPSETGSNKSSRRKSSKPKQAKQFSSFLDLTYWKKTEICCGIIFKGSNGEVLLDMGLMNPCSCRPRAATPTPATTIPDKTTASLMDYNNIEPVSVTVPTGLQFNRPLTPPSGELPPEMDSVLDLSVSAADSAAAVLTSFKASTDSVSLLTAESVTHQHQPRFIPMEV